MKSLVKIFLILSLFSTFVQSSEYDKVLLKAHAKLIPKIIMLDQSLENKLVDGKVKLLIVSESKDKSSSKILGENIRRIYKDKLFNYPLEIVYADTETLDINTKVSAVYIMSLDKNKMQKVVDLIEEKGIISFVYSLDDLNYGALISIRLEAKTIIYFNRPAWRSDNVKFRPGFFRIVKAYEK